MKGQALITAAHSAGAEATKVGPTATIAATLTSTDPLMGPRGSGGWLNLRARSRAEQPDAASATEGAGR